MEVFSSLCLKSTHQLSGFATRLDLPFFSAGDALQARNKGSQEEEDSD